MEGFTPLFQTAEDEYAKFTDKEDLIANFMSHDIIYGFIHCCDRPPELEADKLSCMIDPQMYKRFRWNNERKVPIGYSTFSMENFAYNILDSRHIMMSIILWTSLPTPVSRVIEIGGGYGNWLRLNYGVSVFDNWTIIDLPHLIELQARYFQAHRISSDAYTLISSRDWKDHGLEGDLVIGAHSLSEMAFPIFFDYFTNLILHCKYFFFAYHKTSPSEAIIQVKLQLIENNFRVIKSYLSESDKVVSVLYQRI